MSTTQTNKKPSPVEDLLPWYATGKISAEDRTLVEAALRKDSELVRRLELIREEKSHVTHINESLGAPASRSFDKLMAGIAAEPRKPPLLTVARRGLLTWFGSSLMAFSPRTLALAACGAIAVIAVQTIALTGLVGRGEGNRYQTASAPNLAQTPGSYAMLAFTPTAQASEVAVFLKQFNATIVDGPRASGLYRIRISEKILGKSEFDVILEAMKKHNTIVSQIAASQ